MEEGTNYQESLAQIRQAIASLEERRAERERNLAPNRPSDDDLKKLNSSMKGNAALIRKLKQLSEDNCKSILTDINKTNQSKYVSEAVGAIGEAPLKSRDVAAAVTVCGTLHRRYPDFAEGLIPALAATAAGGDDTNSTSSPARRRSVLRLMVELMSSGVCRTHHPLLQSLKKIAAVDFHRQPEDALVSLSLMTTFVKAGREELLGIKAAVPAPLPADLEEKASAKERSAVELAAAVDDYAAAVQERWIAPDDIQHQYRSIIDKFFSAACTALISSYKSLESRRQANERLLTSRGDLPESLSTKFEAQKAAFESLQRGVASLAEAVDRKLPDLVVARKDEEADEGLGGPSESAGKGTEANVKESPFEDEETKAFYEQLPDIRDLVPAVLLGEEGKSVSSMTGREDATDTSARLELRSEGDRSMEEEGMARSAVEDEVRFPLSVGHADEIAKDSVVDKMDDIITHLAGTQISDTLEQGAASTATTAIADGPGEEEAEADAGEDAEEGEENEEDGQPRRALEEVLSRLPKCVDKELCDQFAVDFCFAGGAGKRARKRLGKSLRDVPQGALQLVPCYSRILAVLAPVFPDIASEVVSHLERENRGLRRRKDATIRTLEPRIRNAVHVAELVKFRVFPPGTAFLLLKGLLEDFSGHNVDAACAFIEAAGRYLSRRPDTSLRMNNMLDVAMKLKNSKNLDARQAGLVESAYYAVKASSKRPKRKERVPVHEFIRYLLYDKLIDSSSVSFVLKKLRRVRWKEDGIYVQRTILRVARKGKYSQLAPLASLVSGLSRYHPWLGVTIVDAVLEEIVAGLDVPDAALYQRRVSAVKFLGHLYGQRLVSTPPIFGVLHVLLAHGHTPDTPLEVSQKMDPPGNFFRIRLVCALLESVGHQLVRNSSQRRRLDEYVLYLQRYVLSKPPLPLDVDLDLQEMYAGLQVNPPQFESYEEACKAVTAAESRSKATAASGSDGKLHVIEEEEEEEEDENEDGVENDDSSSSGEEEEGTAGNTYEHEDMSATLDNSDSVESSGEEEENESEDDDDDSSDEDDYNFGRRQERTEADEEFDRELASLMGLNTDKVSGLGGGTVPIGVSPNPVGGVGTPFALGGTSKPLPLPVPKETIGLRVMLKRGGGREDRTNEIQIPVPVVVAQRLREKEAEEASERAAMKRMVLAAKQRADEEEKAEERAAAEAAHAHRRARGLYYRKH